MKNIFPSKKTRVTGVILFLFILGGFSFFVYKSLVIRVFILAISAAILMWVLWRLKNIPDCSFDEEGVIFWGKKSGLLTGWNKKYKWSEMSNVDIFIRNNAPFVDFYFYCKSKIYFFNIFWEFQKMNTFSDEDKKLLAEFVTYARQKNPDAKVGSEVFEILELQH